jgi:hypothetical protein
MAEADSSNRPQDLNVANSLRQDFLVPLLCNTYSTSQDVFQVTDRFRLASFCPGANPTIF